VLAANLFSLKSLISLVFAKRQQTHFYYSSRVRIVDELEQDLPANAEGEIPTRGPELFIGYTDRR
jgi:hypothetical protein